MAGNPQVRIAGVYTRPKITGARLFFHHVKSIQSFLVTDKETKAHM